MRSNVPALALVLIAGCGRAGFDLQQGDAVGGSAETCNGIDDDGDGLIDEDCPCPTFDVTLTSSVVHAPPITWTGTGYFLVVHTAGMYALHALPGGATTPIVLDTAETMAPGVDVIAWTGSEVAVVLTESASPFRVWLHRFTAAGDPIGAPIAVATQASTSPLGTSHAIWAEDRLAIAYTDNATGTLRIAEVASDGTPLRTLTSTVVANAEAIVASPARYLVAGADTTSNGIVVAFDRQTEVATSAALSLLAPQSNPIQLVRGPDGFAAVRLLFSGAMWQRLDADGQVITATTDVPGPGVAHGAALAPTPTGFRIEFIMGPGTPDGVRAVDVDPNGNALDQPTLLFSYVPMSFGLNSVASFAAGAASVVPFTDSSSTQVSRVVARCL